MNSRPGLQARDQNDARTKHINHSGNNKQTLRERHMAAGNARRIMWPIPKTLLHAKYNDIAVKEFEMWLCRTLSLSCTTLSFIASFHGQINKTCENKALKYVMSVHRWRHRGQKYSVDYKSISEIHHVYFSTPLWHVFEHFHKDRCLFWKLHEVKLRLIRNIWDL